MKSHSSHYRYSLPVLLALLFVLPTFASAQDADPEAALNTFTIHPDYRIDLVAAEPVVFDPVDLEFDARGRPFVVEMPGYPFPTEHGRIVMLKDTDNDGRYETRQVFAEDFPIADSLLPYNGGILVASPPDLIFLKDTNGDDVADVREVVLTGFDVGNPQHNFCGLTHGLDNWIYGANGGNGGTVRRPGGSEDPVPLRYDDFRIDPTTWTIERVGRSTGGFEIALDNWGNQFGTHNLTHIRHLVFSGRYLQHLPPRRSGTLKNISDHDEGPTARIFPIGIQDTRVNHPEQSGYFSGACGITFDGSGAFSASANGDIFVADVVVNLIHRDVITPAGVTFEAGRDRERVEFLASTDRSFRPVNMTFGPDGAMYLLDMHRRVIEHPEWIPDELEADMDLDAGKDKGRIYRIEPVAGLPRATPDLSNADTATLVAALAHSNKWWRDTAQRLLIGRGAQGGMDALKGLLSTSDNPLGRAHAMWTLEGLDALDDETLVRLLRDEDPHVREQAIRIAENRATDNDAILNALLAGSRDESPRVRLQTALTLGAVAARSNDSKTNDRIGESLVTIAARDVTDEWIRLALTGAFAHRPGASLHGLLDQPVIYQQVESAGLFETIARMAVPTFDARALLNTLERLWETERITVPVAVGVLDGLADGIATSPKDIGGSEAALSDALARFYKRTGVNVLKATWRVADALDLPLTPYQEERLRTAKRYVLDENADLQDRLALMSILEFADFDDREDTLFALLDTQHPAELQQEAIRQLADARRASVAERLVAMWPELGPKVVGPAADILLYQPANHDLLLTALEDGRLTLGQLNLHLERRRTLLHSRNPDIRRRAEALFTDAGVVTRKEALQRMRPALSLQGDPENGKAVFTELCATCHRIGEAGTELGPDLTDIFRKSPETLLHDIVDPNAAVETEFISFTVETADGRLISGIVSGETQDAVTIRDATGSATTIPKDSIREMYSHGLSLMPEELEVDMTHQSMADLLAYLVQPR